MSNSNIITISIGGEFVQNKRKPKVEKEYDYNKNSLYHAEGGGRHETARSSINNTIHSLNIENLDEANDSNDAENINSMNLLSANEIMELKELLKVKHKLMKVVNEDSAEYNSITNIITNTISNFDDIQPQTIYVSQKVFKEFKKFTKEHSTTLKQAVSLALMHYMDTVRNK